MVGVVCGVFYKEFHTDMAETILVSAQNSRLDSAKRAKLKTQNSEKEKFLKMGKRALEEGIKVAKVGNRIGHISKTIQDIVEKEGGYSVVRNLVGHGVGRELHEDPEVPGFLQGTVEKTPLLAEGMTIAIEVIYNMGGYEIAYRGDDNWTIVTNDGSLSGVFERTVVITSKEPVVITQ